MKQPSTTIKGQPQKKSLRPKRPSLGRAYTAGIPPQQVYVAPPKVTAAKTTTSGKKGGGPPGLTTPPLYLPPNRKRPTDPSRPQGTPVHPSR